MAANYVYGILGLDITSWVQTGAHDSHGIISIIAAVVLLVLVLKPFIPKFFQLKPADAKA